AELRGPADDRRVLVKEPVAEELLVVVEDVADVLQRVRTVRVAGELHDLPRVGCGQLLGVRDRRGARPAGEARGTGTVGARVQLDDLAQRVAQGLTRLDRAERSGV